MLWLLLGKLPVILSNLWLTWITAKRTGWLVAFSATMAMWSVLALGILTIPSIIGALFIALIAHTLTIRYFIPKTAGITRHSAGAITLAFGLILLMGRVGCWLNGCCFGTPLEGFWATHYEVGSRAHLHFQEIHLLNSTNELISLHPVQLYEALGVLIALLFCNLLFTKRKLNELQASLTFAGLYFGLRALIDPFRTEINTLSSIDYRSFLGLELSLFQWGCLAFTGLCGVVVYLIGRNASSPTQVDGVHLSSFTLALDEPSTLLKSWILWVFSWFTLWLSAEYGTPFSHLLSVLSAWILASLFLIVFYKVSRKTIPSIVHPFHPSFAYKKLAIPTLLLASVTFGLASQDVRQAPSYAYPQQESSFLDPNSLFHSDDQAWVYTLDPLSKKRVRIGRWGEIKQTINLLEPSLDIDESHLPSNQDDYDEIVIDGDQVSNEKIKNKKELTPKPRLRLRLSGGEFTIAKSSGCGGRSVYHIHPIGGTVDYSFYQQGTTDLSVILSSFQVSYIESDNDPSYEYKNRFIHSAKTKLESKYLMGGFGLFIDKQVTMPLFDLGVGINTLTFDDGIKLMVEFGMGSGLEDFNMSETVGLYTAINSRVRMDADKDLILKIIKPMIISGENVFFGGGLSYQKLELLLLFNFGNEQGFVPAMGSLQVGF